MAKDNGLKKIELKVSVDCCDGCKKKVLKALSIKGVLKMEIHPTQPLVMVTGNVDPKTLIKRLAKYGKVAEELLPAEDKKQEKGDNNKSENADGKSKEKPKDGKSDKKVATEQEKNSKCSEANKNNQASKKADTDKCEKHSKASSESSSENSNGKQTDEVVKTTTAAAAAAVTTPLPHLNYFVNPGMMQGAVLTQAQLPRIYYPMDPYMVPVTYPMTVNTYPALPTMVPADAYPSGTYPAAATPVPPPFYVSEHGYHGSQHHHASSRPLPPRLTDYFNDDNTASCQVM